MQRLDQSRVTHREGGSLSDQPEIQEREAAANGDWAKEIPDAEVDAGAVE